MFTIEPCNKVKQQWIKFNQWFKSNSKMSFLQHVKQFQAKTLKGQENFRFSDKT